MLQMAVNSDAISFDRTVTQLIHLCDRVELRKKWCAKVCQDCQQLIRPWPRKFGIAETGKSILEEQLSQGKNREQESSGDCLTPGELEHLRLIEEALKKAGKTRQVFQAKFEDSKVLPKTSATEAVSCSSTAAEEKLSCDSGDGPVKAFNSQAITSKSSTRLSGSLSRRERNHSLPDIGSNQTQRIRQGQSNTDVRKSSDIAVISQTALDSLRTSALSSSKSSKSVVAAKKSGSATNSTKYKPAHLTAPFLTTAQISSGSRIASGLRKAKQPCTVSVQKNVKSLSAVGRLQKTVTSSRNSSLSPTVTSARNSSSSHAVTSARSSSSSLAVSSVSNSSSSPTVTTARNSSSPPAWSSVTPVNNAMSQSCGTEAVSFPVEAVPRETGEKVAKNTRDNNQTGSKTERDETNMKCAGFQLLRDGPSLKLPSELGKALATNHRLREKLKASFTAKPRKLREGESSSESFLLRLQKHMEDTNPDVFSHNQNCHHHSNINAWLESLLDRVAALNISEETPASVVFQAQKIVEFVLHECCGQEDVFQPFVPHKLPPGENTTLKVRQKESMLRWFSLNEKNEGQVALSSRISYQTPSQLLKYMTLVHEIQLVQLQRFLLEEAGSEAIKLLKELDPNDRLFRELYRASYSLVFSLGQSFPAVVQNIEDDDDGVDVEKEEDLGSAKDFDT